MIHCIYCQKPIIAQPAFLYIHQETNSPYCDAGQAEKYIDKGIRVFQRKEKDGTATIALGEAIKRFRDAQLLMREYENHLNQEVDSTLLEFETASSPQ